jgi:hypothetical protein
MKHARSIAFSQQQKLPAQAVQLLLAIAIVLLTSACGDPPEQEKNRLESEVQIQKLENRLQAAENKAREMERNAREAEQARKETATRLRSVEGSTSFHGILSLVVAGLAVAAYFVGFRNGRERHSDDKAIRDSIGDMT